MDKFDKMMKEKYENIAIPEGIAVGVEKEALKRKSAFKMKVLGIAACFMVVLGISSVIYFNLNSKENIQIANNAESISNNEDNNNLPVANRMVDFSLWSEVQLYSNIKPNIVAIVRINDILGYTNYSSLQDRYIKEPVTKLDVTEVKTLYGNEFNKANIFKIGGIILESDFEKSLTIEWEKNEYSALMSEEQKKNSYVEVISANSIIQAEPEKNKTYLVCLKKDSTYDGYICYGKYGFIEYDTKTGMVKNVETGKWEEIDKEILDIDGLSN